jgi:nucleoside-diphosphate-sugar epimerase
MPSDDLSSLPGVHWQKCDLLDVFAVEEVMEGISEVYHCAALVSFDARRREELLHFNPESTANLVNQAISQDVRKLIYVSSIAAIGRTGDSEKEINEEEEWGESRYNSAYGLSKYLAETEVWRGIGEGLNAAIVNPGIIIGEADPRDASSQLLNMAYNEFPFYTRGVTSWVYVQDVVRALVLLMKSEIEAERFILSAANISYRDIMTDMAAALNKKPPYISAGPFLTGLAWRWSVLKSNLSGTPSGLTKETASNANLISKYNNEKLIRFFPVPAFCLPAH